jgi:hypothetical protein
MNYDKLDEAMMPLNNFVEQITEIDGYVKDKEKGINMHINRITVQMPVEMDIIVGENGEVTIGSSPPLYYVETTILPVFHNITITSEAKMN